MAHEQGTPRPRPTAGPVSGICIVALLCLSIALPGCLVAIPAIIELTKGGTSHTATVEIEKDPLEVYGAMLRVVDRDAEIQLESRDDATYRVRASRDGDRVDARSELRDSGMTRLTVTAVSEQEGRTHEQLALRAVEKVCKELGVSYKVVQK